MLQPLYQYYSMKQNLLKVVLLEDVGNKAKGVQITLSAPIAAKLIKDGKAEKVLQSSEAVKQPAQKETKKKQTKPKKAKK